MVTDLHMAFLIDLDARDVQRERIGVRAAPGSDEHMRSLDDFLRASLTACDDAYPPGDLLHARGGVAK
jgi:hypothetical protein